MGLFDWIGEAIGNAASALAEFFGDVFGGIVKAVGGDLLKIGGDAASGSISAVKDPKSQIYKDTEGIGKEITKPLTEGFDHTLKEMDQRHSEIPIGEIEAEVQKLWDTANFDTGKAIVMGTVGEIATLGQVEGFRAMFAMQDKVYGASDLASEIKMMEYRTRYLTMYQRWLNRTNPMMLPGPSDLVRFALREVWDPTRRPELLAEDAPRDYYIFMTQQGFNPERAADYWASHWVLPSVGQLNEMLHRDVITPEEWDRFVKYNDFDPTVRPWLKDISYNPYTRVDTRRMWDLRLLTEEELKKNYKDLGYDEEHAQKMTTWTKVYVLATEMRARYSKGWVTEAEVRTALIGAGMDPARVEDYLQKIIKEDAAERVSKERDLTKTDITRSVKKGLLTKDEGAERLMEMGYSEDEAYFIIDITVSEGISAEIEADRDLSKADIIKGVADGVFTESQGKEMLMKLGYDETEAKYILEIRVPPKKPEKMKPERDLTKAEIVKGVKKEIITWDQGAIMLVDMGYDSDEADFILAINVEALAGSPETWSEMQDIVNKGRRAMHRPVKEIPSGIRDIEGKLEELHQRELKGIEEKETKDFFAALEKQRGPLKRQHKQLVEAYQKRDK